MEQSEKTTILEEIDRGRKEVLEIEDCPAEVLEVDLDALARIADIRLEFQSVFALVQRFVGGIRSFKRDKNHLELSLTEECVRKEAARIRKGLIGR